MTTPIRPVFAALLLGASAFTLTGCETLQALSSEMLATAPKPSARLADLALKDIRADGLDIIADVEVENPYPVPLFAEKLGFALESAGSPILSGTSDAPLSVGAKSTNTVPVAISLPYRDVLSALQGVKPGSVIPYTAKFDIGMTGEDVSPLQFNVQRDGELPVPAPPDVKVTGVQWDQLSLREAAGTANLQIGNTNQFPIDLSQMRYAFALAGMEVADGGISGEGLTLAPGESGDLALDLSFSPSEFGLAAFGLLRGESAEWSLDGTTEVGSRFGPMTLPLQESGRVPLLGN